VRPKLEQLEDRTLPSSYTASTVTDLINDISAANKAGGTNSITLASSTTFDLTTANNTTVGPTGLPVIAKGDTLTITGQGGDVIQRDTAPPAFRLLAVAGGAALTLNNLTMQNGVAFGTGSAADGGAIYNQGSLTLNGVIVQNNTAEGAPGSGSGNGKAGQDAAGGGIWSSGSLMLQGSTTLQGNSALGGIGRDAALVFVKKGYWTWSGAGGNGGNASGGAIWSSGSLTLQGGTLQGNSTLGGRGGFGSPGGTAGNGYGGALYVAGGSVTLSNDTISSNTASSGGDVAEGGGVYVAGGSVTVSSCSITYNTAKVDFVGSTAAGGGIYIVSGAKVYLDSYTVTHTTNNIAAIDPDIDGMYIVP
jgi:hypothetical protein